MADQAGVGDGPPETAAATSQKGCKFLRKEQFASGKWLSLNKVYWEDPQGEERAWEGLERTTKGSNAADGVLIMSVLRRTLHYDCLVLVKQYRPPMQAYTLEFPAGLIDAGEDPEVTAVRELREETGFTCKIKHLSPVTCMDPGVSNCTIIQATAEIDGDDPVNSSAAPNPDDGEFTEVVSVPNNVVLERLNQYAAEGVIIDSRVYSYAIAIAQANKEPKPKKIEK